MKVTKGIVSSLTGAGNNFSNIQIDVAINPGNSEDLIIDAESGNVIGVTLAVLKKEKRSRITSQNTNFGVKTSIVKNFYKATALMCQHLQLQTLADQNVIRSFKVLLIINLAGGLWLKLKR